MIELLKTLGGIMAILLTMAFAIWCAYSDWKEITGQKKSLKDFLNSV